MIGRPSDHDSIAAVVADLRAMPKASALRAIADRLAALAPVNSLYTSGERVQESGKCMHDDARMIEALRAVVLADALLAELAKEQP